jgi:hypothetical protein
VESPAPETPRKFASARRTPKNAVGSQWSVELMSLQNSTTSFEAVQSLRRLEELLVEVDLTDRLRFCKTDFIQSVAAVQQNQKIWHSDIIKEVIHLCCTYFNKNSFSKLPHCVMMSMLLWLPIREFGTVPGVCKEWQTMCTSDCVWKELYHYKFLRNNTVFHLNPVFPLPENGTSIQSAFRSRFFDPHIGDKVEVYWSGKFRLEGAEVYQGSAWWVGEVVDKHTALEKYKIRYPGWDRRWDEWVPKDKLRWAVENNVVAALRVRDPVEIWCCGASVPGAWLVSKVYKIRNGMYCVGKVVSTGSLWVERERLRPAGQKRAAESTGDEVHGGSNTQLHVETDNIEDERAPSTPRTPLSPGAVWSRIRRVVRAGNVRRALTSPFRSGSILGRTRSPSRTRAASDQDGLTEADGLDPVDAEGAGDIDMDDYVDESSRVTTPRTPRSWNHHDDARELGSSSRRYVLGSRANATENGLQRNCLMM